MSAYDSVVVEKLRLKGKPLDVKAGGIKKNKKKKKKQDKSYHHLAEFSSGSTSNPTCTTKSYTTPPLTDPFFHSSRYSSMDGVMKTAKVLENVYSKRAKKETLKYGGNMLLTDQHEDSSINETESYGGSKGGSAASYDDHLTPSERRYIQQTEKLELQRLAKMASRSHRDRIQQFNQYLANLSEHYDIPKVGPG